MGESRCLVGPGFDLSGPEPIRWPTQACIITCCSGRNAVRHAGAYQADGKAKLYERLPRLAEGIARRTKQGGRESDPRLVHRVGHRVHEATLALRKWELDQGRLRRVAHSLPGREVSAYRCAAGRGAGTPQLLRLAGQSEYMARAGCMASKTSESGPCRHLSQATRSPSGGGAPNAILRMASRASRKGSAFNEVFQECCGPETRAVIAR